MVTTTVAAVLRVQVIGREVLEELGEREPAAVPPVEGAVRRPVV